MAQITVENELHGSLNSGDVLVGVLETAINPDYALARDAANKIEFYINSTDYKFYAQLKDKNNNLISTSNIIDLPLESMVVNGSYDSTTKEVILTLNNGNEIRFSVADLVEGLVSNTDYATANTGGVIKTSPSTYGVNVSTTSGAMYGTVFTYAEYPNKSDAMFISKGTLDNVLTAKIGSIDSALDAINGEVI